ncbi:MAG: hypothetical protein ACTH56_05765 [Pseudoalteromonas sp.]
MNVIFKAYSFCLMGSAIFIGGYAVAADFDVPVVNPYLGEFHWSVQPSIRNLMALDELSKEKLSNCMGTAVSAGNVAASMHRKHFKEGKLIDELSADLSYHYELDGYTPVPSAVLEPWDDEKSSLSVDKTLEMRKLDVVTKYYESYENLKVKNSKNIVAQQLIWDYCMSIPKEAFLK